MALKFKCPSCNENIGIRYLSVGEVAECKKCRSQVVIPQDAVTISDDEAESLLKSILDHSAGENRVPNEVEIESRPSPSRKPLPSSSNHKRIEVAGKEYELASRGIRWLCAFLDYIIAVFVASIIAVLIWWIASFFQHDIEEPYIWLLRPFLFIFVWLFKDGVKNGQSLAKKLHSIRVINSRNGNPCNYRRSFVRNLLAFLPFDALFIFGKKRQRLGDKMAGTLVVSDVVNHNRIVVNHNRIEVAGKEYELASRGIRWWGAFLDNIITLFVVGIIAWVLWSVVSFIEYEDIRESNIWIALLMSLFIFGCFFKDGAKNGQSLAKKLCSIRVINSRNGNPCNYRRSFVRNLLAFLPFDALFIFGKKRQRLGDKMAETLVVKYRSSDVVHQESRSSKTVAVLAILFVSSYGLMYFTGEIIASDAGEKIVKSIDGQIQVTIPSDWVLQPELHDEATLAVGNIWTELYLIVLPQNKSDFIDMNLERYSQITKDIIISSLESPETSAPLELIIHNNRAIQYEIRGIIEGMKVVYLHTNVEDSQNYYQIITWTLRSRFRSKKDLLQQVIQSFQATPPESLWKIE